MSDEQLREFERRWKETGAGEDRQRYSQSLKRAADHETLVRLYSPMLEEGFTPQLRTEYFSYSPIQEQDKPNLEHVLSHYTEHLWLFGTALMMDSYNVIRLAGRERQTTEYGAIDGVRAIIEHERYLLAPFGPDANVTTQSHPTPIEGNLPTRIVHGILNCTRFEIILAHEPFAGNPAALRVRVK
ncbi:hypothetical protein J4219_07815 [Candidatus Woesearchaeota archaeon]|nr:hypothetical protein [Candidatus Woesearchaeota archaeon]